jgi:hypothetical protein
MILPEEEVRKGKYPVAIAYKITPVDHISKGVPIYCRPKNTSGGAYSGVPHMV